MNEDDKKRAQALVNKLLKEASEKAATADYRSAVTAAKKAKALDQGNVFLLALERQLEQINDLAVTGTLTDAQKTDILESVPRLVEQASNSQSLLEQTYATPAAAAEAGEARLAAGRWLKNQYFQRAHDFVRDGEYDHALGELRKIFSIDEQDQVAREFEMKIMQMLELKRRQPPANRPQVFEQTPQNSPSAQTLQEELHSGSSRSRHPRRKKKNLLPYYIILTVIAVILAAVFFWHRSQSVPTVRHPKDSHQERIDDNPSYPVPPASVGSDSTASGT
jgi:hypothetical protein